MHNDEYEISDPITIGGATGQYFYSSPWNTECEWAIISACALGAFNSSTIVGLPVEVNVPATAGNLTVVSHTGQLLSVLVTATGIAELDFTDFAGTLVGIVPASATLGQVFQFNSAFTTSLIANKTVSTPVVTVTYVALTQPALYNASFAIGSKNPKQPSLSSTGIDKFGSIATSGPDSNNGLLAFVGALTPSAPMISYGMDEFMPLADPNYVSLTVTCPANTEVLVTIQMRRKLDRIIPDKPRQKPQTHTHAQPRKGMRTLMEGFAEREAYPGDKPYQHMPVAEQDTAVARHGLMPAQLGPTQLRHRGMKHGR